MWGSYTASNPNLTIERHDRLKWRRNIVIILIAASLFTLLIFMGLAVGYHGHQPWINYEENSNEYCEAARNKGFVKLPSNAWFSLPLLAAAAFVAYGGLHDLMLIESRANSIVSSPAVSLVHAVYLFAAFITTFLAYSCDCKAWFIAAIGLQNSALAFGVLYALLVVINSKLGWNLRTVWVTVAQAILLPIFALLATVTDDILQVFLLVALAASLVAYYICEYEHVNATLYHLIAVLCFVALIVWLLDVIEVLCKPYSAFQWHSIWTVLISAILALSYALFRSENYTTSLQPYTVL